MITGKEIMECTKCKKEIDTVPKCPECIISDKLSESTLTANYVNFSAMASDLTEIIGAALYFVRETGKEIPYDKIDTSKWHDEYLGINKLPRDQVQLNTFKLSVDSCVARILQVVEKYT